MQAGRLCKAIRGDCPRAAFAVKRKEGTQLQRRMPKAMVMLALLALSGLPSAPSLFADTPRGFHPKEIRMALLNLRKASFQDLAEQLSRVTQRKVEVDPRLAERRLNLALRDISVDSLLETVLPSQGATWRQESEDTLVLTPLARPWSGPRPEVPPKTKLNLDQPLDLRIAQASIGRLEEDLRKHLQFNVLVDARIQPRPIRFEQGKVTVKQYLDRVCALSGWQWAVTADSIVILPSQEEQVMNFAVPRWRQWTYDTISFKDLARELSLDLGIPLCLSKRVANLRFTGTVRGETAGDVIDSLCRQQGLAYAVHNGCFYLILRGELPALNRNRLSPPELELTFDLWRIALDDWQLEDMDRFVADSDSLSSDPIQSKVDQIKGLPDTALAARQTLRLEDRKYQDLQVQLQSTELAKQLIGSAQFRYLSPQYVALTIHLYLNPQPKLPVAFLLPLRNRMVHIDRPLLFEATSKRVHNSHGLAMLLVLHCQLLGGEGILDAARYQPIYWRIPQGSLRNTDKIEECYYGKFPGKMSEYFLPESFSGHRTEGQPDDGS